MKNAVEAGAVDKSRLPSRHTTEGINKAPQRAMMYGAGVPEGGLDLPLLGIFTTWNDGSPCNLSHREQAQAAKAPAASVAKAPARPRKRVAPKKPDLNG